MITINLLSDGTETVEYATQNEFVDEIIKMGQLKFKTISTIKIIESDPDPFPDLIIARIESYTDYLVLKTGSEYLAFKAEVNQDLANYFQAFRGIQLTQDDYNLLYKCTHSLLKGCSNYHLECLLYFICMNQEAAQIVINRSIKCTEEIIIAAMKLKQIPDEMIIYLIAITEEDGYQICNDRILEAAQNRQEVEKYLLKLRKLI